MTINTYEMPFKKSNAKELCKLGENIEIISKVFPWQSENGEFEDHHVYTSIAESAFESCDTVKSIKMPSTVQTIEKYAFKGCSALESISLPEKMTRIKGEAFKDCESLKEISLPEGLKSIETCCFSGCSSLKSIVIPEGVNSIGSHCFSGCSSLKSIIIPEGVTSIDGFAFSGCINLESVTLPSTLTKIDDGVFQGCEKLTCIFIPKDVKTIGTDVFSHCSSLNSIIVDAGNRVYDSRNNCNAIIATKRNELIAGCPGTIIPDDVISIAKRAFYQCGITAITIPKNVTNISEDAFHGSKLTSITIPENVKNIGEDAFRYCCDLKSVVISTGVESIGLRAFKDCDSLKEIFIDDLQMLPVESRLIAISTFVYRNDCVDYTIELYNKYIKSQSGKWVSRINDYPEILAYMCRENLLDAKYIDQYIEEMQKSNNTELLALLSEYRDLHINGINRHKQEVQYQRAVVAAKSLEWEPDDAINNCIIAFDIHLKKSFDLDKMKKYLDTIGVKVENSVSVKLDFFVASTNPNKKSAGHIKADELGIRKVSWDDFCKKNSDSKAFAKARRDFEISSGVLTSYIGNETTVTIPVGVKKIDSSAFRDNNCIESVVIPDTVTRIEYAAFMGCGNLKYITIPSSVKHIHDDAFKYCVNLERIEIAKESVVPAECRRFVVKP